MKNISIEQFNSFNYSQKVNYVKNLLFNCELQEALNILLLKEKKDLEIINIILKVLQEELTINRIKQQCNINNSNYAKLFVFSKILSILSFYNKTMILNKFLKGLDENLKKEIAIYEYQNKTNVSFNNNIFNKHCLKYKEEALRNSKISDREVLMLTMEMEKYNKIANTSKKNKLLPILLVSLLFLVFSFFIYKTNQNIKLVNKYKDKVYPGIYLNEIDLTNKKISDLSNIILNEKEKISNGTIIVTNVNGNQKYSYKNVGINIETNDIEKEIKNYINNLSFLDKVNIIKNKKNKKVFYLKGSFDDNSIDKFITLLEEKLNVKPKDDGIVVDTNYNVYYDKGANGFTLNSTETKKILKETLNNLKEESVIEVKGEVIKNKVKHESLSTINKKVSSHTTYFNNYGNRGHNIVLASSRLNNTILMPEEEFSYLKVVGPYGASNGYLPAPIYLNGVSSTANGGGVCQLASTLYNAQLKAGLQTVSRRGHSFAPTYVPKGLDATVYSTSTNFKFKNNLKYPIYITSYVKGNYLTVDIWSNENALEGKVYEPYSVYSNGGYLAYLKVIENGKLLETKYLDKTYYKSH